MTATALHCPAEIRSRQRRVRFLLAIIRLAFLLVRPAGPSALKARMPAHQDAACSFSVLGVCVFPLSR